MKRLIVSIIICSFSLSLYSQGRVVARKNDIKDFATRTTMVVLDETPDMMDAVLRGAVEDNWIISPYSFCSTKDFERLKTDTTLYFLMRIKGQFKRESEPGLEYLSLVKGGTEADKGLDKMQDIVTMPLQPVDDLEGRSIALVPAFIKIIQSHVRRVMDNKATAYSGLSAHNDNVGAIGGKRLLFEEGALSSQVDAAELEERFKGNASVVDEDEIDEAIESAEDCLVAITISPKSSGGFCYKMVINASTGELIFYNRHKMNTRSPGGFLKEDIKRLSVPYSFNK